MSSELEDGPEWRWRETIHEGQKLLTYVKKNDSQHSNELWDKYIHNKKDHFMMFDAEIFDDQDTLYIEEAGWNQKSLEDNTKKILSEKLDYQENDQIIIFWSKESSVYVNWKLFLSYWSDFIYSSDEGVLIVNPISDMSFVYILDKIWIFKRKLIAT
ncbi:DUF2947 family protein [Gimesia aquarii]|uniref:DUF2947 family protein n=1 Tax=Gimesia aquarii TaxID=2527964 RepID=A0A517WUV5_9PLAN|nr:DUF2947 family protein [Gimesia aquarii]QDU09049.1 hypothetical protein V202x_24200 [Gimesia aquarii]